ncbi:hypothetical protein Tco_0641208 [Tanacetum coccineum]
MLDYAGASLDRKSTTGGCQFLGCRLISWQCKKQTVVAKSTTEAEYVTASSCYGQVLWIQNHLLDYRDCYEKKLIQMVKIHTEKNVADLLAKAFDFWSTVMAKNINREEQLHALVDGKKIIITESSIRRDLQLADEEGVDCLPNSTIFEQLTLMGSQGTNSGGGPWCQETMRDTIAQTRFESVSKHSNDSLLARGNTLRSDEDRLKLNELMTLCTTLQNRVLDLEKTKTTQHNEIATLKRRVKKLEKKNRSRTHRLKRLYKVGLTARVESSDNEESLGEDASKQGRIDAIDADEEITLVSVHDVNVSAGEEVFATTVDDITLAQVLEEMKSTKPKKKRVVIQELGESTTTISSQLSSHYLHNNHRIKDDIHAKIDVDHQLAEKMQAQEQEELSIKEKATLLQQLLEKKRKHLAAKRAKEKRNKPPIKAQQRKIMCTYLKNMKGYKLKDLKLKEFDSIQKMFDRAFKRVNTIEDFRTELVKGKEKIAGTKLASTTRSKQSLNIITNMEGLRFLILKNLSYSSKLDSLPSHRGYGSPNRFFLWFFADEDCCSMLYRCWIRGVMGVADGVLWVTMGSGHLLMAFPYAHFLWCCDKGFLWWLVMVSYGGFLMGVSDGVSVGVSDGLFLCGIVWLIGVADAVFLIRVPDDVLLSDAGLLMPFADKRVMLKMVAE